MSVGIIKMLSIHPIMGFIKNAELAGEIFSLDCLSQAPHFKLSTTKEMYADFGENLQRLAEDRNRPLGIGSRRLVKMKF
jgi:hypothetical protein